MTRLPGRAVRLVQLGLTILLALLLACNLYLLFLQRVVGVRGATVAGFSLAVISSGSMEPVLEVDDLILNHAQDSYRVGDIITFDSGTGLTTHRIVAITPEGFITRGDSNNVADQDPVAPDAVVGRVVAVLPVMGRVLAALRTPLGLTVLLVAGFLWTVLFPANREQRPCEERGTTQP